MSYSGGSTLTATTANGGGDNSSKMIRQQHQQSKPKYHHDHDHQVFASSRHRLVSDDEFRVGSYVVHSPLKNYRSRENTTITQSHTTTIPTATSSINTTVSHSVTISDKNTSKLPSAIVTTSPTTTTTQPTSSCNSHIPGYSFKTKIASLSLSPPSSPRRTLVGEGNNAIVDNYTNKSSGSQPISYSVSYGGDLRQQQQQQLQQSQESSQVASNSNNNKRDYLDMPSSAQCKISATNRSQNNNCEQNAPNIISPKHQQKSNIVQARHLYAHQQNINDDNNLVARSNMVTINDRISSTSAFADEQQNRYNSFCNGSQQQQVNQLSPSNHKRYTNNNCSFNSNRFEVTAGDSNDVSHNSTLRQQSKTPTIKSNNINTLATTTSPSTTTTTSSSLKQSDNNSATSRQVQRGQQIMVSMIDDDINHDCHYRKNGIVTKLTPRLPRGVSKIPHQVSSIVSDNINEKVNGDMSNNDIESNNNNDNNSQIVQLKSSKETSMNEITNKYLTFNKIEATSQIKSLKEELLNERNIENIIQDNNISSQSNDLQQKQKQQKQQEEENQQITKSYTKSNPSTSRYIASSPPPTKESPLNEELVSKTTIQHQQKVNSSPTITRSQAKLSSPNSAEFSITNKVKPSDRHSKQIINGIIDKDYHDYYYNNKLENSNHIDDRFVSKRSYSSSGANFRQNQHNQQPICEAFIMTGQSMMKLSCNESDNTQNHANQLARNSESKVKSELSLNSIKDTSTAKTNTIAISNSNLTNVSKSSGSSQDLVIYKESKQNNDDAVTPQKEKEKVEELSPSSNNNITEPSLTPTTTYADRESARRLAKRLYNLSGFKRSDVCHHLSKNNPFSQMVAEEYLKLFDFRTMKLDCAVRKFLSKLQLNGETQERERLLCQFSQRFYDCNKEKYHSADTVQTLVCALILLNTDLHGGHSKKKRTKLSLGAFIDGLNSSIGSIDRIDSSVSNTITSSNNGNSHSTQDTNKQQFGGSNGATNDHNNIPYSFPRHLLVDLYESIKKRPLKCSDDKCDLTSFEVELDRIYSQQQLGNNRSNTLPTRRFVPGSNAPSSTMSASSRRHLKQGLIKLNGSSQQDDNSEATIQFKTGFLNRKRVFEANRKPTSKGRRSWRRVHISLSDLRLIMRPALTDEDSTKWDSSSITSTFSSESSSKQKIKTTKSTRRFQLLAQDMKNTLKIHHTLATRSTTYTKREFVFHLKLANQCEFLLQANNEQDLTSWIDTINFASACLSAPALPNAISNSNIQQRKNSQVTISPRQLRPLLPISYTRLSYWEQLINHEERLQRFKIELEEHIAEASNTMTANKKSKTDYIEKIAYLKQEIERYNVYVDLMRKKSNSPEAIILSKHPQIASLTPSPEMLSSFPTSFTTSPSNVVADERKVSETIT